MPRQLDMHRMVQPRAQERPEYGLWARGILVIDEPRTTEIADQEGFSSG